MAEPLAVGAGAAVGMADMEDVCVLCVISVVVVVGA